MYSRYKNNTIFFNKFYQPLCFQNSFFEIMSESDNQKFFFLNKWIWIYNVHKVYVCVCFCCILLFSDHSWTTHNLMVQSLTNLTNLLSLFVEFFFSEIFALYMQYMNQTFTKKKTDTHTHDAHTAWHDHAPNFSFH